MNQILGNTSSEEMDKFEEEVIAVAAGSSGNNGYNNRIFTLSGSVEPPGGGNRPRLTYDTKAKAIRIIRLKADIDKLKKYLTICSFPLVLCILLFLINFDNYIPNVNAFIYNTELFPKLNQFNMFVLIIAIITAFSYFYLSGRFKTLNDKLESFRRDMTSFIGAQICFCNGECNCRDAVIIVMEKVYSIKLY